MRFAEYKQLTQGQKRDKNKRVGLQGIGYLLHRNISIFVSYFIVRFLPFVTPNMLSVAMLAVALYGSWLIFVGDITTRIIGVLVVYLSFLLDKVDGEVARYKKMESLRGVYLDEWYHALAPFTFLIGFFFPFAYGAGASTTLLLMLGIFLTLFRRYERKWFIIIARKKRQLIQKGAYMKPLSSRFIDAITNNLLLRGLSIVERFDLLLAVALVVLLAGVYGGQDWMFYFLTGYVFLSALYSIRWLLANYFGTLDERVSFVAQDIKNYE
jgi:phosphatidylglycerophosphate synthase